MLRSEIANGTELGMQAKQLMDQGVLVPDETVISMIQARIERFSYANGFIFDGFPRTAAQAEALDRMLEQRGTPITLMLALEVNDDELTRRIMERGKDSGRADDQDETIVRNRITEYNNKTAPLKDYYTAQGKYHAVNGIGSIDGIFNSLSRVIESNYKVKTKAEKAGGVEETHVTAKAERAKPAKKASPSAGGKKKTAKKAAPKKKAPAKKKPAKKVVKKAVKKAAKKKAAPKKNAKRPAKKAARKAVKRKVAKKSAKKASRKPVKKAVKKKTGKKKSSRNW
jgi:adenylate kinase